jgi:hypothetical protein
MTDQIPPGPDWRHVMAREDAQRAHDKHDAFAERLDTAAIKSSEKALGACLVINGGAAIAVLSFIGGLASRDAITIGSSGFKPVADSLEPFAFGVVAAVAGMALSYLAHLLTVWQVQSYTKVMEASKTPGKMIWLKPGEKTRTWHVWRNISHALAASAGVVSVIFFALGIFAVRDSVEHLPASAAHTQAPSVKPGP